MPCNIVSKLSDAHVRMLPTIVTCMFTLPTCRLQRMRILCTGGIWGDAWFLKAPALAHIGIIIVITPAQVHSYSCFEQYTPCKPRRQQQSSQLQQRVPKWAYVHFPNRYGGTRYDLP